MNNYEYYYSLNSNTFDLSSENIIKTKYNKLASYYFLKEQLNLLKTSFIIKAKTTADIMINVYPSIEGVNQIYTFHKIKFKRFSKNPTENCFAFILTKQNNNKKELYFYNTINFQEVDDILYYFINKQKIPDLEKWKTPNKAIN